MRYLILDTSFIIQMIELGKDLVKLGEDYADEILIPVTSDKVIKELETISKGSNKKARLAKAALSLASKFEVLKSDPDKSTDEDLIEICTSRNGVLATADLEILNKALKKGIEVLFLKEGKKLAFYRR